jgi:hypothetical protein
MLDSACVRSSSAQISERVMAFDGAKECLQFLGWAISSCRFVIRTELCDEDTTAYTALGNKLKFLGSM